ncbi:hypothetical protein D9757_006588 [Collybiopsis confluens]|uniref:Enoyl reductase (ER) domain-containing protein n=1 Tax=Collybiopsis confluens TaxID=2823264 RepID=A0A8H5HQG6_9AGAR|nr:hypothetical protein D9757_006588 [Collybiopsis confluens]
MFHENLPRKYPFKFRVVIPIFTLTMAQTQRALFLTSAHQYEISSRAIPKPSGGQILVKVKSISLNPTDWKVRDLPGMDIMVKKYPIVLGHDAAGDVVELGEGVTRFSKNDRVFFQCAGYINDDHGAFQEYVTVPAEIASKIPLNLSYNQAASISLVLTTATVGLLAPVPHGAGLSPTFDLSADYTSQSAFVLGGGTSTGQFAIQLLKILKFKHIITNSAEEHFDYLRSLGATDLIDRNKVTDEDLPKVVESFAGGKVDAAIDAVGTSATQTAALACLKDGKHLGTVLFVEREVPKNKSLAMIWGSTWLDSNREFGKAQWPKLERLFESGTLKPCRLIELTGGLSAIGGGIEDLKNNKYPGQKIVISMG